MRKVWKKVMIVGSSVVALSTVAVGALHMPFAKPWLMRLGGCPMVQASPRAAEAARALALQRIAGKDPAPSRPALGFELERTTNAEVRAWSEAHSLDCTDSREHTLVVCKHVPAAAVGEPGEPIAEIGFLFRSADQKLLNVTSTRTGLSGEQASALLVDITGRMRRDLGTPTSTGGDESASSLGETANSYLAEYRFKDYVADTSAMNMGTRGVILREHYVAAGVD